MTYDHTEQLIRDAFAAEADRAPDPRPVRAALARARQPRRHGMALVAAAVVVAVVAVAAVVLPKVLDRSAPAAGPGTDEPQNVLLVGEDSGGYVDTIVLGHLRADGTAAAMSLPRDSWVRTASGGMDRLAAIAKQTDMDTFVATVSELTGVRVDHYAVVDMAGVGELADAVGGVPVCLRRATSDPASGASFPAGKQTLRGDDALAFVRQRRGLPGGDLERIARQQAFLAAVAAKLPDADVGKLLDAMGEHVRTDPGWDLLGFAGRLRTMTDVQLTTAPVADGDHRTPQGAAVVAVDPRTVREYVAHLIDGEADAADPPGPAKPLPAGDAPCVN